MLYLSKDPLPGFVRILVRIVLPVIVLPRRKPDFPTTQCCGTTMYRAEGCTGGPAMQTNVFKPQDEFIGRKDSRNGHGETNGSAAGSRAPSKRKENGEFLDGCTG